MTTLQLMKTEGLTVHYNPVRKVPDGWALCCPFCEEWVMRVRHVNKALGFKCSGCAQFISKLETLDHKELLIVEIS
jgi:hypothetical protein